MYLTHRQKRRKDIMTNGNRILASLAVLLLCAVFGASQALGQNVTIGGKVLTLANPPAPVAGATVSVYPAGTPSTTTAGDGSWSLSVPAGTDPVLKIGATEIAGPCGSTPHTAETYTQFPLSLLQDYQTEPYEYDISAVPQSNMALVTPGYCLIIGFALQYTSLGYPAAQTFISGVDVDPEPYAYLEADGATPCYPPDCTATTASGAWVDMRAGGYSTAYTGTKTGSTFSGGDVTCVADTANVTGLVDDNLPPLP
jgi:hypothetical protein